MQIIIVWPWTLFAQLAKGKQSSLRLFIVWIIVVSIRESKISRPARVDFDQTQQTRPDSTHAAFNFYDHSNDSRINFSFHKRFKPEKDS